MEDVFTKRVKDQLPTVLLTLLSIVQALALELMWERVLDSEHLYTVSFPAVVAWLQLAATFLGVLLVWLIYSTTVMRFRWVPTTTELMFPFLIGILEFLLVALMEPPLLGPWFVVFGVVFVAMSWGTQGTYRRARQDSENESYFGRIAPATWRDFLPVAGVAVAMSAAGTYLWLAGPEHWFAALALSGAIAALLVQMYSSASFWRRTFERKPEAAG